MVGLVPPFNRQGRAPSRPRVPSQALQQNLPRQLLATPQALFGSLHLPASLQYLYGQSLKGGRERKNTVLCSSKHSPKSEALPAALGCARPQPHHRTRPQHRRPGPSFLLPSPQRAQLTSCALSRNAPGPSCCCCLCCSTGAGYEREARICLPRQEPVRAVRKEEPEREQLAHA